MIQAWKVLNSPLAVSLVGATLLGAGAFFFEAYIDDRNHSQELNDQLDRRRFEYAGRLSQYSEWLIYLLDEPSNLVTPEFKQCVAPIILRRSIAAFASVPSAQEKVEYFTNPDCQVDFKYSAMFSDFQTISTISLLSEMYVVHEELVKRGRWSRIRGFG
jgi:hypothetical protein